MLEQVVRAVGDDDQPPLARGLKSHPGRDEHALGLGEDLARREVWLQRALVHPSLHELQERLHVRGAQRELVDDLVPCKDLE